MLYTREIVNLKIHEWGYEIVSHTWPLLQSTLFRGKDVSIMYNMLVILQFPFHKT